MKLKGVMTIDLIDAVTGEVDTVVEENMITNSVNNILGINPAGMYLTAGENYDSITNWNDVLLPICPNMIGGILLFSSTLAEDVNHIYEGSGNLPVAYASNDVNATADTKRGSMNLTESKVLDNGYRFVWEFTPSQGNGTIAAVALTSAQGGKAGYGSTEDVASPFLQMREGRLNHQSDEQLEDLALMVYLNFEEGYFINARYQSSSVILKKHRMPVFDIGLNERLNDMTCTLLDEQTLHCTTFKFPGSYTPYGNFFDGGDGYIYGFANQSNSSGNATLYWIKIKLEDYSFTEGVWTLSNVQMQETGSYKFASYPDRFIKSVVRNGYLYTMSYDKTAVYKINVNNQADVTKIQLGFTSAFSSLGGSGSSENHMVLVGDLIIAWDFQITANDEVIPTLGAARFKSIETALFAYKNYLTCISGSYGSSYHHWYILTPYLASINNLDTAVVKTTDKTMKITYELTEVEPEEET